MKAASKSENSDIESTSENSSVTVEEVEIEQVASSQL